VRDAGSVDHAHQFEARPADAVKRPFAGPEDHRHHVELEAVDRSRGQVLADDVRPASDHHVALARRLFRVIERGVDPVRDEDERGAALHLQRIPRVTGQYEDRRVIRRIVAPPASPRRVLAPRARAAAEHVPAHDDGTDVRLRLLDGERAGVHLAALQALCRAPGREVEHPLMERHPALAERVLLALVRAGHVSVE
jgi:hypothetical protein